MADEHVEDIVTVATTVATTVVSNCSYLCGCEGLLLPLINESGYTRSWRAFLYLVGLLYSFLGVAIAAEVFMIAIERITSTKKKIPVTHDVNEADTVSINSEAEPGYRMVNVWNPTVANLTLMALGSSAPEILLSCIEIIGKNFEAGALGPGTIVGSAAFNLLCITGICISAIPSPDIRRVDAIMVFLVTGSFSVFAYVWLLIILLGSSKGYVDTWEAFLTLLFFPILVVVAYIADKKYLCRGKKKEKGSREEGSPLQDMSESKRHLFERLQKEAARNHPDLTPAQLARLVANQVMRARPRDRMFYRIQASKYFEGNRPLAFDDDEVLYRSTKPLYPELDDGKSDTGTMRSRTNSFSKGTVQGGGSRKCTVEFSARIYAFTGEKAQIKVRVVRTGRLHKKVTVRYDTVEGSAKKNEHFLHKSESLVFKPNETVKTIELELVPDGKWGEKDGFFIHLHLEDADNRMKIGTCHPAIIRYSEKVGDPVFEFQRHNFSVKESLKVMRLPIEQTGGTARNAGTVKWRTEDVSAHDGQDYVGGTGELRFEADEVLKYLDIPIIDDKEEEKTETFMVYLQSGPDSSVGSVDNAVVAIVSDDSVKEIFTQMDHMIPHFLSKMEPGASSWRDQIVRAISLNNGDMKGASGVDICMHILSFPFKVVFALVPPPGILGGWPTFFVALALIGLLTAIVGDLAGIFGCLVNLKPEITAITFVALGTSLPDTFASRLAAIQDTSADNAIGNVTGSNSVNVFLGLGLPWLIAAIYHESKGGRFKVTAGALGFSVAIYTTFSVLCLGLLVVRRYVKFFGRGELGGPTFPKWASAVFCFILWFLYVLLSALQSYCHIPFPGYKC